MKKMFLWWSLFVYLIFGQFFIKAQVSLPPEIVTADKTTCMQKILDAYEGKYDCWKLHNSGTVSLDAGEMIVSIQYTPQTEAQIGNPFLFFLPEISKKQATGPPGGEIGNRLFLEQYMGISYSLVYG